MKKLSLLKKSATDMYVSMKLFIYHNELTGTEDSRAGEMTQQLSPCWSSRIHIRCLTSTLSFGLLGTPTPQPL